MVLAKSSYDCHFPLCPLGIRNIKIVFLSDIISDDLWHLR